MHDAVALANLIYALPTKTSFDIAQVFEAYRKERYPAVMASYKNSQLLSKVKDRGALGVTLMYAVTHMPHWLWRISLSKLVRFRPQCGFLPLIESKGTVAPVPSRSENLARAVFENRPLPLSSGSSLARTI